MGALNIRRSGHPVIGFGSETPKTPVPGTSPWTVAIATSVVGAATGWVIEEIAKNVRRKRQR